MRLSLCQPYYKNPLMLSEQYRVWAAYPDDLKAQIEVVLVDDGSPQPARDVTRPVGLPPLRIYRVLQDLPWHQHGARNLAAKEAEGDWLFLTDMDHVLPADSLRVLLWRLGIASDGDVFTFFRRDAPDLVPTRNERGELKPHVNTFAITKAHYWRIGGYDEDAVGYGTDGYFRARLKAASRMHHLTDVPVIRYPREVIPDASGSEPGVDPKAFRNRGRRTDVTRRRMARKAATGIGPTVLNFVWTRVL